MINHPPEAYQEYAENISQVLISTAEIEAKVAEIGAQISQDYQGKKPLLVGVLKGVLFFIADLLRAVTIPVEVDLIAV